MHPRLLSALAVFSLLALLAAGCGGDSADEATESGDEPAAQEVPDGVAAEQATIEEEVAAEGGEETVGPWRIAYIVEPPEGWFEQSGGDFEWRPPAQGETHHIEILPIEAETGRVVPNVPIELEVLDAEGRRVDGGPLTHYYAEFFHYADNFSIPQAGDYTLRAEIGVPELRRHGEEAAGPALAEGTVVEFPNVTLEPGEDG